jgi:polar amino acid transport system substrate-binding protein
LVRNRFSVISAGTEASTVAAARANLVQKAKQRPDQVKQVLNLLRQQGPVQTYRAVTKKLDAYSPLGYSSSGTVLDVAPDVRAFSPGDKVACAGVGYANHAEVVAVPVNLCVRLAPEADLRPAAYNTIAAIAMQGIRQADLRLGETCGIIGLGLIGQLTAALLRSAGVRVVGLDVQEWAVGVAAKHCADLACLVNSPSLTADVSRFTCGIGLDAVIITAGTSSLEPINLAGELLRRKGRAVIVGAVPTGFERPNFYMKELELRMSCSYGPGRYDALYEEHGIDYPVGHVRWTENRNMQAFHDLVQGGRVNIGFLTTHEFPLESAPGAYDLVVGKKEPHLGIVIAYPAEVSETGTVTVPTGRPERAGTVTVGFVGAGSYAMGNLLPNISGPDVVLKGALSAQGTSSRSAADRYGFEFCTSSEKEIFGNTRINTVFVATRHDSHARYVLEGLRTGKNVFVEKPLCLKPQELTEIEAAATTGGSRLMVGYNRRFAPLTTWVKERMSCSPATMLYRVNAGSIPPESWIQDPEVGGGRIVGEACHFIDLMIFFAGSLPVRVFASAMDSPHHTEDSVCIVLRFANGSVGSIVYAADGSKGLAKEYFEIHGGGNTAVIRDFREAEFLPARGKPSVRRLLGQDKGQKAMVESFLDSIRTGKEAPIPLAESVGGMKATFGAVNSLRRSEAVAVS